MSNFFMLELDTTGPQIDIYMPTYTLSYIETEIRIQSNENLALYQDIYIIDSKNERRKYIFEHCGDYLLGKITFNEYPSGIVTIYARLKDDVYNFSNTAYKSFLIQNFPEFKLEISDCIFENIIDSHIKHVSIKDNIRKTWTHDKSKILKDMIHIREINLKEEEITDGR